MSLSLFLTFSLIILSSGVLRPICSLQALETKSVVLHVPIHLRSRTPSDFCHRLERKSITKEKEKDTREIFYYSPPPSSLFKGIQQPRFPHQLVEQTALLHQLGGCVEFGNSPGAQHDDAVRVEDGVDAVRDRDDGAVLEDVAPQRRLQHCVRLDVDGGLGTLCQ